MVEVTEQEGSVMEGMNHALQEVNKRPWWIWGMFLLTSSPGMFNAYHIMVSNFYAFVPPHWCRVQQLEGAGWTSDQISAIVRPIGRISSCTMLDWNYTHLAALGYTKALGFVTNHSEPGEVPCTDFVFDEKVPHSSTVSEWNLVCDREFQKSNVQGSIAIGKFFGGFIFGFIADRYGRKVSFVLASLTYIVFGPLAALSPSFWFFIIMRFLIGVAGSGCYETGFTILSELVNKERRALLGCIYNLSYPVGYMTLPLIAVIFTKWRHLQLAISLPMLIFFLHWWLLPESPRWLITQGKNEKAWNIIERIDKSLVPEPREQVVEQTEEVRKVSLLNRLIGASYKMIMLFSTGELCKRISIAYFAWFVAALSYYVLALNAVNFSTNQYVYTFLSGLVEVPGYTIPLIILMCLGRKSTTAILFFISGLSLVSILGVPRGRSEIILAIAMLGRFTDVAVFGVVVVYTSELFPTTVRNTAIGSSLAISQLGSIYAPYIVDQLGKHGWYIPSTICGCTALLSALLVLLLPETRGKPLMDTIDELKQNQKQDNVTLRNCCKLC